MYTYFGIEKYLQEQCLRNRTREKSVTDDRPDAYKSKKDFYLLFYFKYFRGVRFFNVKPYFYEKGSSTILRDETANNGFYRLIWNPCFNFDENDTSSFFLETSMVTCEQPSFFGRNPMLVQSGLCDALLKLLIGFDALFLSIWDPIRSPSSLMSYSRLWSSSVLVVKAKKCWGLHPLTIL